MDAGGTRGFLNLLVGRIVAAETEIFLQGPRKKERLLHDHAQVRPHPLAGQRPQFAVIDPDLALRVVVEPQQQVHQRAFPGPGGSKNSQSFPRGDVEREPVQRRQAVAVAETKIAHGNRAPQRFRCRHGRGLAGRFAFGVQHFADAADGDHGLAQIGQHPPHLPHRPEQDGKVREKPEQDADAKLARGHPVRPDNERQPELAERHKIAHGPIPGEQPQQLEAVVAVPGIRAGELVPLEILPREGPHHTDAGKIALDHGRERTLGLVDLAEDVFDPAKIKIAV